MGRTGTSPQSTCLASCRALACCPASCGAAGRRCRSSSGACRAFFFFIAHKRMHARIAVQRGSLTRRGPQGADGHPMSVRAAHAGAGAAGAGLLHARGALPTPILLCRTPAVGWCRFLLRLLCHIAPIHATAGKSPRPARAGPVPFAHRRAPHPPVVCSSCLDRSPLCWRTLCPK